MKFDGIELIIKDMISERYEMSSDSNFENELMNTSDYEFKYKNILRLKRYGTDVDTWKTLVIVEIEGDDNDKNELKKAINWIALIKESLIGTESADLYMFLAFNGKVSKEECVRIESTEQFCRKYVLLPHEEIIEFLNRTFIPKLMDSGNIQHSEDPIEKAFLLTSDQYAWLTPEVQKKWKKAFLNFSGNELIDAILNAEELK
ncbi:MAG: ABC-three component system middle component 1 [Clostridium sp.]|uniref:ABC-three component system middle component 1 n=1 Tax=Clostridium sp. TaxID=1506 RepID=UPI002A9140DC|nr:ABC-three component system middle component 1 [Clostridium sp.]MDY6227004.1 ABC-three component system middle component 1 [Clostridium sp.]